MRACAHPTAVRLETLLLMYLFEQFYMFLIKDVSKKMLYWELKFRSLQTV